MVGGDLLFVEERRNKILELLRKNSKMRVNDLAKIFGVSTVTIRKDLEYLESIGALVRTHGGAILPNHSKTEWEFFRKLNLRKEEKQRIARKALYFIENGDTIILDSGSTTFYIAREIRKNGNSHLTVVTNNIFIAEELLGVTGTEIIILGGSIRDHSLSLIGPWAMRYLQEIKVDKAFLGTLGFSQERGFMTPSLVEADVKRAMIKAAGKVFIVTDSSKFQRGAFAVFAQPEDVDFLITDPGIPEDVEKYLLENEVRIIKT